jgi:hypothetical protein
LIETEITGMAENGHTPFFQGEADKVAPPHRRSRAEVANRRF